MIAAGPGIDPVIGVFNPTGKVDRFTLKPGESHPVTLLDMPVTMTLDKFVLHGRERHIPVVQSLDTRRPNLSPRSMSAIRLKFTGRGEHAGWSDTRWCTFSQYSTVDARPITVALPNGEAWEVKYSRARVPLDATVAPGKLSVKLFPGGRSVDSWKSEFRVDDGAADGPRVGTVATNETYPIGHWTLYQSGASQDHWSYTILGVGNRRGIWPMTLGCIMITLGSFFAFYIKPIIRRRAQLKALASASKRGGAGGRLAQVTEESPELMEVGS
jgi:hypothetical protein